jgi:hypothetical protein
MKRCPTPATLPSLPAQLVKWNFHTQNATGIAIQYEWQPANASVPGQDVFEHSERI